MLRQPQSLDFNRRLSVAPMLDWTDRHCRYFLRLITRHTLLYTEMVTTGAIIYGKGDYLGFNQQEHPLALQLGGSDPTHMAQCAHLAEQRGYDEVNINVGCPSDRVQNGAFGACLMATPQVVAECVKAMQDKVSIPVTVKCRIGIDDMCEYEDLTRFTEQVIEGGCDTFIIHARKAWLQGLSPKQNRDIPPLIYDRVYQLKQQFPHLHISINGGIKTLWEAEQHLQYVDGVMIGREVYANPYMLAEADQRIYGDNHRVASREEVIVTMADYIDQHIASGGRAWHVMRHMLGLFQGLPGARIWRRYLSENGPAADASGATLLAAYADWQARTQHILESSQID
ncbi:tRNA dihydrouridine(20/20a) synthase DusA [Bowmanella sp. JS7-9]|uniref:tRNA-dihydrouridine(20/20a) synthase n=1 Tax=Pseudobowmanella zhangzhouensis TaxID=1537679 RepID=A0ABW1XMY4_9ALTE|nr:tRNA dihydrouridine(20/20a) synthase DusA [Bowmanella sp. JS7-9]TBX20557.1 tRNA-dihydrouridine synthase A [Bowmanella sp. JS7-9]